MALSNWDTLAIDEQGNSTNAVFESPMGVVVEFYKNWIYVRDEKAWCEGAFSKPTVMEIQKGHLRYKDVHIVAIRGPQEGIYAAVWSGYKDATGMVGCGVYGYSDDGEFIGVTPGSQEFLQKELLQHEEWYEIPESLRKIDPSKGLRFNQGDAYFADHLGLETPATPAGQAEGTVMQEMMGKIKE